MDAKYWLAHTGAGVIVWHNELSGGRIHEPGLAIISVYAMLWWGWQRAITGWLGLGEPCFPSQYGTPGEMRDANPLIPGPGTSRNLDKGMAGDWEHSHGGWYEGNMRGEG